MKKIQFLALTALVLPLALSSCTSTASDVRSADAPNVNSAEAEMKAYMEASTPGDMHKLLSSNVGSWTGTSTMKMEPNGEASTHNVTSKVTSELDGRFIKIECEGDTPMGKMKGFGFYGFDNVGKRFVSSWLSNCGTDIMSGEGKLSSDGKTITWNYECMDALQKKDVEMREIQTWPNPDTMKFETWMKDPKSGREFKACTMDLQRVRN